MPPGSLLLCRPEVNHQISLRCYQPRLQVATHFVHWITQRRQTQRRSFHSIAVFCCCYFAIQQEATYQIDDDSYASDDSTVDDIFSLPRHDELFLPISSSSKGVRRLTLEEILRLHTRDEFILFLPPYNRNDNKAWRETSNAVLGLMKRVVMAPYQNTHSSQDRDVGWFNHLNSRRKERDGAFGYDFNIRVVAYPERDSIEKDNLPESHLNHLMNPTTGAGITVELMGYGTAVTCHLKLHLLPFLEIYVPIKDDECVIQELPNFTTSTDDQKMAASLIKNLLQTKGDNYAYANILITYYKRALEATRSAKKAIISKRESSSDDAIYQKLTAEVSKRNIDKFANEMDSYCYKRLKATVGFDHVRRSLLLDEDLRQYYIKFKDSFPTIHLAFYSIIESRYFNENNESNDGDESSLHKKQRMILFLFLASCRVKSVFLLKHWAITEPLGMFYKGHQQLSAKSISGAFSATLPTSLAALEFAADVASRI